MAEVIKTKVLIIGSGPADILLVFMQAGQCWSQF